MTEDLRPTFAAELVQQLLGSQIRKSLLRKPFMELGSLLSTCALIFEISGHLGCEFSGQPVPFVTAFAMPPEMVGEFLALPDANAAAQRNELRVEHGATIQQLCVEEFMRSSSILAGKRSWSEWLDLAGRKKVALDFAWTVGTVHAYQGAMFGLTRCSAFKLAAQRSGQERGASMHLFELAGARYQAGVRSDADVARESLTMFDAFCERYYPDVLAALGRTSIE